jgi:hypothetical protein
MTMNRFALLTTLCLFVLNITYGQKQDKYSEIIKEAASLYETGAYQEAGEKYAAAFKTFQGTLGDRYNAACAWALANQPDSAFVQLFEIAADAAYTNSLLILTDTALKSLHSDKRFIAVIKMIESNKQMRKKAVESGADIDKSLVAMLDTIHREDQKYRNELDQIEKEFGSKSDEVNAMWKIINEKDSINLIAVKKVLDERGWLGPDIVGENGSETLFLVIQHADLETQEHYLPMLREAVKKGNAKAKYLAYLEDRVAVRKGGRQIYGTQLGTDKTTGETYVLPVVDPENVDKRRVYIGLLPLEDYLMLLKKIGAIESFKKDFLYEEQ